MILTILSMLGSELAVFVWLSVAFVAAIIEVSVPHFGSVFVTIGAIAAAAAAYFDFAVPAQVAVFAIVLVGSLVGLRSRLSRKIVVAAPATTTATPAQNQPRV